MFDIGWSEMAVILLVALVVIGPRDLPRVARTVGRWVAKGRAMAREFQSALEDMAREAELDKVKSEIEKVGRTNLGKTDREHASIRPASSARRSIRQRRAARQEARGNGRSRPKRGRRPRRLPASPSRPPTPAEPGRAAAASRGQAATARPRHCRAGRRQAQAGRPSRQTPPTAASAGRAAPERAGAGRRPRAGAKRPKRETVPADPELDGADQGPRRPADAAARSPDRAAQPADVLLRRDLPRLPGLLFLRRAHLRASWSSRSPTSIRGRPAGG